MRINAVSHSSASKSSSNRILSMSSGRSLQPQLARQGTINGSSLFIGESACGSTCSDSRSSTRSSEPSWRANASTMRVGPGRGQRLGVLGVLILFTMLLQFPPAMVGVPRQHSNSVREDVVSVRSQMQGDGDVVFATAGASKDRRRREFVPGYTCSFRTRRCVCRSNSRVIQSMVSAVCGTLTAAPTIM